MDEKLNPLLPRNQSEQKYKNVAIANNTKVNLNLFIYPTWLISYLCFPLFSTISIIIAPGLQFHSQKSRFKYEIIANFEEEKRKHKILGLKEWDRDILINVAESLEYTEEKLDDFPEIKQICLRKAHLKEELTSTSGKANYYDILGLDMDDVRGDKLYKSDEERKKAILKAHRKQLLIWHPDKHGDNEITQWINEAKDTLVDPKKRADYHNEADYDKGWLSRKRYKAIFLPECYTKTEEQKEAYKKAYKRRMMMMVASLIMCFIGLALPFVGASLIAAPWAIWGGTILGTALFQAGWLSGWHSVNKNSVLNECNVKSWLLKVGIGLAGGAISGTAAAAITTAVVGIGSTALESCAVTLRQFAGINAASGTIEGAIQSLASDVAKKFVDGEQVTWKQCLRHVLAGAAIGAVAGALTGMAIKGVVSSQSSAATASLQGEALEQVNVRAGITGTKRFGYTVAEHIVRGSTQSGTEAVLETAVQFAEERLDDSVPNQHPREHFKNGAKNLATSALKTIGKSCLYACGKAVIHTYHESKVRKAKKGITFRNDNEEQVFSRNVRKRLSEQNGEHLFDLDKGKVSRCCKPITKTGEQSATTYEGNDMTSNAEDDMTSNAEDDMTSNAEDDMTSNTEDNMTSNAEDDMTSNAEDDMTSNAEDNMTSNAEDDMTGNAEDDMTSNTEDDMTSNAEEDMTSNTEHDMTSNAEHDMTSNAKDEPLESTFRFKSNGFWFSKIIVTYAPDGKKEAKGSGRIVKIPADARQVEVRFQVRRPFWGNIMKYDRFKKTWCRPYEPHVFRYDKPPVERTFTVSGNLWWEAVMRVSDEYHDETGEI